MPTDLPDLTAPRNALANCGEETRMVHRDHLRDALGELLTAYLATKEPA